MTSFFIHLQVAYNPTNNKNLSNYNFVFFQILTTEDEWLSKAVGFSFPNCIGTLGGKHIMILPPAHTASEYFNY